MFVLNFVHRFNSLSFNEFTFQSKLQLFLLLHIMIRSQPFECNLSAIIFLIPGEILVHCANAYQYRGCEPHFVCESITSFVSDYFQFYSADFNSVNMLPSVLLLLLLISGAQASFYGVVFNYAFGDLQPGGYAGYAVS